MKTGTADKRIDTATRLILAPPRTLYRAFLDPEMVASWRAPEGMRSEILAFEGRLGGGYRMAFHYRDAAHAVPGKSGPHVDRFTGTFVELVPDEMVVERIQFESDDPAFATPMTVTTTLKAVTGGTKVTVRCTDVPALISTTDHQAGLASSLRNLAMLTE